MAYASTNPYTGKILQGFDEIDDAALEARLQACVQCAAVRACSHTG